MPISFCILYKYPLKDMSELAPVIIRINSRSMAYIIYDWFNELCKSSKAPKT